MSVFKDDHNHELWSPKFCGLKRPHRKINEGSVSRMNSMRKASISTPKIFGYFATLFSGFDKIGF